MTHDVLFPPPSWIGHLEASRHRLAVLTGSCEAGAILTNMRRMAPGCVSINLSLALSRRLLAVSCHQRPAQAPILLADLLAGDDPAILYNTELLFEPTLQLEPLRALKGASRSRVLLVPWPGVYEDHKLTYAEPGHPEYKRYGPGDLTDIVVAPATDLAMEA